MKGRWMPFGTLLRMGISTDILSLVCLFMCNPGGLSDQEAMEVHSGGLFEVGFRGKEDPVKWEIAFDE